MSSPPRSNAGAGLLYTLLAALGFAAVSTFTQISLEHGTSLWNVQLWRFVIGAAVMIAFCATQRYGLLDARDAIRWIVLGGGGQALFLGMALSSLAFIPIAMLGFLFYSYPVWVAIIQAVRGAERLTPARFVAVALSFIGIVIIAGSPTEGGAIAWQGVALCLGAAFIYALYIPLMHHMQKSLPIPVTNAYAKVGSALCFLAASVWTQSLTLNLQPAAWASITALAILSTVLPAAFFMMGLMRLGPVRTAIISTVEPFITSVLGALVLLQPLTPRTFAGGALIVLSVIVLQAKKDRLSARIAEH